MTRHYIPVLVLSNQADKGILHQGEVRVDVDDNESLGVATLRTLRCAGVVIQDADVLFFPNAGAGHRVLEVKGEGFAEHFGWDF